jgi:hypothetical protein
MDLNFDALLHPWKLLNSRIAKNTRNAEKDYRWYISGTVDHVRELETVYRY